jgi:PAS domain S-box-containing protein
MKHFKQNKIFLPIDVNEFYIFLFNIFLLFLIIFATHSWINDLTVRSDQSGLKHALHASGPVREQLHALLTRIAVLQQSALSIDLSFRNDATRFDNELNALRKQIAIAGPEFLHVGAADAEGRLTWSTALDFDKNINISDRKYFQELLHDRNKKIISSPVVGKIYGKQSLQFAWSVEDFNGKFKGIIFISIDATLAVNLQKLIPADRNSIVNIVLFDGEILTRSIEHPVSTIATASGHLPLNVNRAMIEGTATFRRNSPVDGIDRFFAVSHIPEWNAMLIVGLETTPEQMQLAQNCYEVELIGSACGLASVAATLTLIYRRRGRLAQARINTLNSDLERRETLLLQIAKNTTDMIVLLDADFRYIFMNDAVQRTFGGDASTWLGRRIGTIANPCADLEISLAALALDGGSRRLLWDIPDLNGVIHWIDMEIVAVDIRADDFVSPCRYFAVARDVTERVAAKQQVVASQQQLVRILRLGPGFFFELHIAVNGECSLKFPVDSTDRLLGYTQAEATCGGILLERQMPLDDVEISKKAIQRCIDDGWSSVEFRAIAKDGSPHWLLCQMQLIQHEDNETDLIGFVTDITSEHAMRRRLRHSEQLATLGSLSANIAHEMNQPLAALSLTAENAIRLAQNPNKSSERITAKLENIQSQVFRLSKVINSIRQFSRNDQGRLSEFDLITVIEEAVTLVEARINSSGVMIDIRLAENLPKLHTEHILLEQILVNLIANACDAYTQQTTQNKPQRLEVIISAQANESGLKIVVADHAGGIASDVLDRLFEPFVTTKSNDHGTGLGLSICGAHIAELGGTITARNADGGAIFEITLPQEILA